MYMCEWNGGNDLEYRFDIGDLKSSIQTQMQFIKTEKFSSKNVEQETKFLLFSQ